MSQTQEYVVIRKGLCLKGLTEEKIGTKVDLTDEKAKSVSGKVELLKDYQLSSKSEQELIKEKAKLTKQVAELTAQLDEATAPKSSKKDK